MRHLFAASFVLVLLAMALPSAQQPSFRSGVDLIAVDVQVVDNEGRPQQGLDVGNFQVSIQGRRRRVVSADLVRFDASRSEQARPTVATTSSPVSARPEAAEGRTYILAIDTMSFRPAATRDVVAAARSFVGSLRPNDRVAVVPFPLDRITDVTTDHATVLSALDRVVGTRSEVNPCRFNPSDIVDFTSPRAPDPRLTARPDPLLVRRAAEIMAGNSFCDRIETLISSAKSMALMEEAEIAQRLESLRAILKALAASSNRKTVVLLSAGIISADVSGGRPDVGIDLGSIVGQDAARANATIYTLWTDSLRRDSTMAAVSGAPRSTDNYQRDAALVSAPLDRVTAASGGAMFNVIQGGGEFAFDRILRETSAHYVLGVEPEPADRDGVPRRLEVRVSGIARGTSVRSRSWFAMPKASEPTTPATPPDVARVVPPPPAPAPPPEPTPVPATAPSLPATPAELPPPPAPVIEAALVPVLTSAASYLDRFVDAFGNVVAEERYVQDVLTGGRLMVRPTPGAEPRHRDLRSDLVLVRSGDELGWQAFRDVFEVDGKPVRDRAERLSRLFEQPAATALEQATRIARESARYNIGAAERTVNTPVLALLFLRVEHQPRFQFSRGTRTAGFSDGVDVVEFQELARPTIVRTVQDTDRPSSGRFWIDRETGAVLQTELSLTGEGVSIRFTTLFRHDESLKVAVPVRMQEEYVVTGRKLVGTATYGSFRRFSVSTDTNVATPGRSPQ